MRALVWGILPTKASSTKKKEAGCNTCTQAGKDSPAKGESVIRGRRGESLRRSY